MYDNDKVVAEFIVQYNALAVTNVSNRLFQTQFMT